MVKRYQVSVETGNRELRIEQLKERLGITKDSELMDKMLDICEEHLDLIDKKVEAMQDEARELPRIKYRQLTNPHTRD